MESEIWKVYKESFHPTRGKKVYEVSDQGNVKINGELVNLCKTNMDYYFIGRFYVHRAVAELYIPNPENKPCIDHINGDRLDNRLENLRWVTYKENNNNPITKERQKKAIKEAMNRPEVKAKHKAAMNTSEYKENQSKLVKEILNRPEVKTKLVKAIKEATNRPEVRAKRSLETKDRKFLTNGIDLKFVKPELFDYYLERGYHFGRK
jgi:hypothetical protein